MEQAAKIPEKLMELVRREAEQRSCSIREQIAHWMEIAQATGCSDEIDFSKINETLGGMRDVCELHEGEHAVWVDAFSTLLSMPSDAEVAFFARRRRLGLGVGLDEAGHPAHARPEDNCHVPTSGATRVDNFKF